VCPTTVNLSQAAKFHSSPHKDCLIGAWAIKDPDKVKFMALAPLKAKRRQLFAFSLCIRPPSKI